VAARHKPEGDFVVAWDGNAALRARPGEVGNLFLQLRYALLTLRRLLEG
jgi:hypothetical protein